MGNERAIASADTAVAASPQHHTGQRAGVGRVLHRDRAVDERGGARAGRLLVRVGRGGGAGGGRGRPGARRGARGGGGGDAGGGGGEWRPARTPRRKYGPNCGGLGGRYGGGGAPGSPKAGAAPAWRRPRPPAPIA